jgi:hypothetical protein
MLKDRVLELKQEMLCARTARRQQAAKAELTKRGVSPRVLIGSGYIAPAIARTFSYLPVGGAR